MDDDVDGKMMQARHRNGRHLGRERRAGGAGILRGLTAGLLSAAVLCLPAAAQGLEGNLFAPRLIVNDRAITGFEVMDRARMFQLLRIPGDPVEQALKSLTEDRLRQAEAARLDLRLTPEALEQGLTEFAGRASLTAEQFAQALAQGGVAVETWRDFVANGLLWREAVRARYRGRVQVTETEIDRAFEAEARRKPLRVLLSELVIPLEPGREDEGYALAARLSDEVRGEGAFAAAAGRHSAAPTAGRGGRLDWMPLSNLPGQIAASVVGLEPGDVSDPISVPGAVVLFQLRAVAEDTAAPAFSVSVEWAEMLVPDTEADIARITAGADRCNDLYALSGNAGEDVVKVTSAPMAQVPGDVGMELARLDPGEISTALRRGEWRRLVMLCTRKVAAEEPPTREAVREALLNRKLEGLAEGYLEELRAAAIIREP